MKKFIQKLIQRERSAPRLARSIAAGVAMAVSPYYTLQTWLLFPLCWIMSANVAVSMTVLWTVNNPWTMIPLIVADYFVGYFLFEWLLNWDLTAYNPGFMTWFNEKIIPYVTPYIGIDDFCLWCFILGGTIVAVCAGIATYVAVRPLLARRLSSQEVPAEEQ